MADGKERQEVMFFDAITDRTYRRRVEGIGDGLMRERLTLTERYEKAQLYLIISLSFVACLSVSFSLWRVGLYLCCASVYGMCETYVHTYIVHTYTRTYIHAYVHTFIHIHACMRAYNIRAKRQLM